MIDDNGQKMDLDSYIAECALSHPPIKWGNRITIKFEQIIKGISIQLESEVDVNLLIKAIENNINDVSSDETESIYYAAFDFVTAVARQVANNIVQNMSDSEFGDFEADSYSDDEGNFDCDFDLTWKQTSNGTYDAVLLPEPL